VFECIQPLQCDKSHQELFEQGTIQTINLAPIKSKRLFEVLNVYMDSIYLGVYALNMNNLLNTSNLLPLHSKQWIGQISVTSPKLFLQIRNGNVETF
jgi:sensor histidine kinase regulating citrate/malate metabolism